MMILILDFCFMVLDANLLISNCVHVGVRTSHSWIVQLLSRWQFLELGARFGPTCYRVSCRRPILATTCPDQPSAYLWAYVAEIEGGADQSGSINWLPKEFVRNNLRCKGALRWCTMAIHFKGRAEPIKIWINLQTWDGEREEQLTMHKGDCRSVKMTRLARN